MKEHKHAEILRAIADGKEVQYRFKKNPVDLSVLINSNIDCEFWNGNSSKNIHKLASITNTGYKAKGRKWYKKCRPRMNHWHNWIGGECPLPGGFVVDLLYRDGRELKSKWSTDHSWRHSRVYNDIIAFKVVGLADGYCYPWENEE